MTNNIVNIMQKPVSIRRQALDWYTENVFDKGIQRNKPQNNWKNVSNPEFTHRGKPTDLENYFARTFTDKFTAEDLVHIARFIITASDDVGFILRPVDEKFLEDILMKIKMGKYDKSVPKNIKWRMAMVLLDQVDQNMKPKGVTP